MTVRDEREGYTQSQEKLLRATLEIVNEVGVERATTRLIAARAGVNIQLIQYYFGGKDGMLDEVQRYVMAQFFEIIGPVILAEDTLAEGLRAGMNRTWELALTNPEITQPDLLLQTVRAAREGDVPSSEHRTQDHVRDLLERKATESGETVRVPMEQFALLVTAGLSGLVLEFRARGNRALVGASIDTLADLLVSLVEPASP